MTSSIAKMPMMRWIAPLMLGLATAGVADAARGPAVHPVVRNINLLCGSQSACVQRQWRSMQNAFAFMRTKRPPVWKIEQCNRNAAKQRSRIDWIGFDNCIRNPKVKAPKVTGH